MIVCICNNVNSKTLTKAIEDGANTLEKLCSKTNAANSCGKCQFKVNRILQDTLSVPAEHALFVNAMSQ